MICINIHFITLVHENYFKFIKHFSHKNIFSTNKTAFLHGKENIFIFLPVSKLFIALGTTNHCQRAGKIKVSNPKAVNTTYVLLEEEIYLKVINIQFCKLRNETTRVVVNMATL